MKGQKNGVFLVLAAAVLMSFGGLMIKAIPWNAMAVNSGRNLFAALVTFGYMKAMRMPVRVNRTVMGCAACITACNVAYTLATRLTTAANAVVLQYTTLCSSFYICGCSSGRSPGGWIWPPAPWCSRAWPAALPAVWRPAAWRATCWRWPPPAATPWCSW